MKNIIFITDDWGYTKGGINTINMDLCKATAALTNTDCRVFCIVIFADEPTIEKAKTINVELISLYNSPTSKGRYEETDKFGILYKLRESSITNHPTWVIGHDVITGKIALILKESLLTENIVYQSYSVIIHHMDYEDYEVYKDSYAGEKLIDQRTLLKEADILFGVGPRLKRSACSIKQNNNCPQILPGIDVSEELISTYKEPNPFRVIVCGRIGTKDDNIKNAKLAVKSWAKTLQDERLRDSHINLIGCSESQREELVKLVAQYADRCGAVNPYEFVERAKLIKVMADHSLCIMPSLKEGFGLTGWEAISLGVPVILSEGSGAFEFLNKPPYSAYISAVDIRGNEENDMPLLQQTILKVYNNYPIYKERALELREVLIKEKITWENTASQFLEDLETFTGISKKKIDTKKTVGLPCITHFTSDVFTDRSNVLDKLFTCIEEGKHILNLYGKKGIGKSSVLRFMSDGINGKVSNINQTKNSYFQQYEGLIKQLDVHYIELASQNSLKKAFESLDPDLKNHKDDLFARYIQTLHSCSLSSRHLIILDNAHEGQKEELFELYQKFLELDINNFCLLIGSVKALPFDYLSFSLHRYLDIAPFEEEEIIEYAKNNNYTPNNTLITDIKKISGGLPIYVKLLLKRSQNNRGTQTYTDMEKYLEDLLQEIEKHDKQCHSLVLHIVLLSVICESGKGVPVKRIKFLLDIQEITRYIDLLENDYSLIEHNQGDGCVKMHDLVRDIYIKLILKQYPELIRKIMDSLDENDKNRCYYLLLLDANYNTVKEEDTEVITTIRKAVETDDYIYLLSLGEYFCNIHSLKEYSNISNEMYLHIIWGYMEGCIGVGNYPEARILVDACKISSRNVTSEIHLQLSLTIAKLYHLQNNYQEAIQTYQIILNETNPKQIRSKYKSLCYWGIAHSYRHEGDSLQEAYNYYNKAIQMAKEEKSISHELKSELEQVAILDIWGKYEEADALIKIIQKKLDSQPENKHFGLRISIKKGMARHLRIAGRENKEDAFDLLNEVLADYKKIKKRLQYNTLFELGEYYRDREEYQKAFDKYKEALIFSKKNKDKNLYTMGLIGILLCELGAGKIFRKKEEDDQIESDKELLVKIIEECKNCNLKMNDQIANLLLDFISYAKVDQAVVSFFTYRNCHQEMNICKNLTLDSLKKLNLTLM